MGIITQNTRSGNRTKAGPLVLSLPPLKNGATIHRFPSIRDQAHPLLRRFLVFQLVSHGGIGTPRSRGLCPWVEGVLSTRVLLLSPAFCPILSGNGKCCP